MRQAGILAAAIDYALDNNVERLQSDHANARRLAEGLAQIDEIRISSSDTNMVFIELPGQELGEELAGYLAQQGVKIIGGRRIRLVTHLDVGVEDVDRVVQSVREFFESRR